MPSWILGLGLSHDASACLLVDGDPLVGVQLERLTGRKHDGRKELAHLMVDYCLSGAGVTLDDIDAIGVSFPDVHVPSDMVLPHFDASMGTVLHVGHHLAHAYSAFAPSDFKRSGVLVIDGHGDSYYESDADRLIWGDALQAQLAAEEATQRPLTMAPRSEIESIYWFDRTAPPSLVKRNFMGYGRRANRHRGPFVNTGIGANYKFASSVLFGPGEHSGKVMGLAPYGTPRKDLPKSYWIADDGDAVLDDLWRHQVRREVYDQPDLPSDHEWAAGLAAYVQRETQELVELLARQATVTEPNLCMAGGVALNATTNGELERELGLHLYVQPASSDAGLALGAAYAAFHHVYGRITRAAAPSRDGLGKRYSPREIDHVIAAHSRVRRNVDYDQIEAVAEALADGLVVGWFEGGSEFGPRALGHRSILADPRRSSMRVRLNQDIKDREWFRPFGPVVLEEHANQWFVEGGHSDTMTSTTYIREDMRARVPAVAHVDGSSRIQLLRASQDPYRFLLEFFHRRTGIPMLINTSFNAKDRPIVESPTDALSAYVDLGLDVLWLDGRGIVRR